MDDNVQNGLQSEQWLPLFEKGEKRANSLGSGALRFIRTRSSIRQELKRQCNRSKNGDSSMVQEVGNGGGGGGFGKWLREHLGGGSKGGQDCSSHLKANGIVVEGSGSEKSFGKTVYTSQNLYCSLPREHGRHSYNGPRKTGHGNSLKPQGHDRQRSSSVNHHEKTTLNDLGTLTRGGPIYGSEGKTMKKRNRDRRRHSLNETHEQGRQRRRRVRDTASRKSGLKSKAETFGPPSAGSGSYLTREVDARAHETEFAEQPINSVVARPSVPKIRELELRKLMTNFNFEEYPVEEAEKETDDFEDERGEEDEREEPRSRVKKRTDAKSEWYEASEQSDDDEKYGEAFHEEEEVGEGEEEIPLSPTVSAEKLEKEVRQVEESDHVLAEIPAEVTADRDAIINRLKELQSEQIDLRQKNRLLELWVTRWMKKTQQRMTPADITRDTEKMEQIYKEVLRGYKMQIDEILTQQSELTYELQNYTLRVHQVQDEVEDILHAFLEREKEVAVGLVYEQTGKKITDKTMNVLTRRQMTRTKMLARDRRSYIFLQHRLEDLITQQKSVETLGEGMTTMDYEVLHIINIGYKDRLDERDHELEKLRLKIAETVNGLAHYKEKEVCVVEDIDYEDQRLTDYREENTRTRESVNNLHLSLNKIRDQYNEKRIEAGLLVARQELLEMQKQMKLKGELDKAIKRLELEIQYYKLKRQQPRRKTSSFSIPNYARDSRRVNRSKTMARESPLLDSCRG